MRKLFSLLIAVILVVSMAASPVFAGGGKVQGDEGSGEVQQGAAGYGSSPGNDAMGNQV